MDVIYKKYGATIKSMLDKSGHFKKPVENFVIESQPIGVKDEWYTDKVDCGKYKLMVSKRIIASWELYQMKNCCGICVSTAAMVHHAYRKQGLGLILNQIRMDLARIMGYSLLLCTDVVKNTPQQKILSANKWKLIHRFVNQRTKNEIGIHVIGL